MTTFQDFLQRRLANGGFTTEDALACFLPLARQTAVLHIAGDVAPLEGVNDLQVDGARISFDSARRQKPRMQPGRVKELGQPIARAVEVVGELKITSNVDQGDATVARLNIGQRGQEVVRPVY